MGWVGAWGFFSWLFGMGFFLGVGFWFFGIFLLCWGERFVYWLGASERGGVLHFSFTGGVTLVSCLFGGGVGGFVLLGAQATANRSTPRKHRELKHPHKNKTNYQPKKKAAGPQ